MSKKPSAGDTAKKILWLILAAVLFAVGANLIHPKRIAWVGDWGEQVEADAIREGVELVLLSDMINILRDHTRVLVDVRSADAYARGHIPGAISVPFESMAADGTIPVELLRAGPGLVFYCSGPTCDDNLLMAIAVREIGRDDVAVFIGGMELWESELLAVEEGAEP
jgi:rhodanese-related sulfurtransferase